MTRRPFLALSNRVVTVNGLTDTGTTDGGGNPIYTTAAKGTVRGRIDKKDQPDELDGPDLNPIVSGFEAYLEIPNGFTITERDTLTDNDGTQYEIVQVGTFYDRSRPHHLQADLKKVTA